MADQKRTDKIVFGEKKLYCYQGDITDSDASAIVNAANNHLWMGAGVAGAIKRAGGQAIEDEAIGKGPIEVGQAIATGAHDLKARYVIHAAVMGQDLRTDDELIKKATANCLKLAEQLKIRSIDFPALGTGVGGFSIEKCADLMIAECHVFLTDSVCLHSIGFALFNDNGYESFSSRLSQIE